MSAHVRVLTAHPLSLRRNVSGCPEGISIRASLPPGSPGGWIRSYRRETAGFLMSRVVGGAVVRPASNPKDGT